MWLAALLLFAAACAPRPSPGVLDQFDYFYLDPYRPRFARTGAFYETSRPAYRKPQRFLADKGVGERRVFIVGGSVAELYDGDGPPTLRKTLEAALPGLRVSVINEGSTAYDSPRDLLALTEALELKPDWIVVMSGVNERFERMPPALLARLCSRRVLRGLLALDRALFPERLEVLPKFEAALREMARRARARGVPLVFCTLPANWRDMPPKGSLPKADPEFSAAWDDLEKKRWRQAAAGFRLYAESRKTEPFGWYFLARSLESLGDYAGARESYLRAWNLSYRGPLPRLNETVRMVAREEGVGLADLETAFSSASPHGLIGRNLMEDDVHWDRRADALASVTIAKACLGRVLEPEEGRALAAARRLKPGEKQSWMVFRYRVWDPAILERGEISERELALLETIRLANPRLLADSKALKAWLKAQLSANLWDKNAAEQLDRWWPALMAHVAELYRRNGDERLARAYLAESRGWSAGSSPPSRMRVPSANR